MWRPYKHVALAYRSVSIPRPYLSTAQHSIEKKFFFFLRSQTAPWQWDVRRCGKRRPAVPTVFGRRAPSQVTSPRNPAECRCELRPHPNNFSPLSPHSRRRLSSDRMPPGHNSKRPAALPPAAGWTTSPGRPRARPAHSHLRPKRIPELSARFQGLEIEQNRLVGEGKSGVAKDTRDGGLFEGAESPIWLSVFPCPSHNCRARRPRPVPRASGRSRGRFPPGFFADSCQAVCSPQASVSLTPFPPTRANLGLGNHSRFAVLVRRRNAAHKPFPSSPRRGLLPVCGPQEAGGGEAPRCHGDALCAGGRAVQRQWLLWGCAWPRAFLPQYPSLLGSAWKTRKRKNSATKTVFTVS